MDEKHLILEQYRIYNEMKESFINRSFMINRFFIIMSAVLLFGLIFAKMLLFNQFYLLLGIEIFGLASCIMWISNQDAYSTIIKIKYNAVIVITKYIYICVWRSWYKNNRVSFFAFL